MHFNWSNVVDNKKSAIPKYLNNVLTDFRVNIDKMNCLCSLKKLKYDGRPTRGADYNDEIIQQYYLLRYGYAYFCEYSYAIQEIVNQCKLNELKILSLGAGSCIDFQSAYYVAKDNSKIGLGNLKYHGIDLIDWKYREFKKLTSAEFNIADIASINLNEYDNNVLFFPKSLNELPEPAFTAFCENINKNSLHKDYLIFLTSNRGAFATDDNKRFEIVENIFKTIGYNSNRINLTFPNIGTYYDISNILCPNDIKKYLNELSSHCKNFNSCKNGGGPGKCDDRNNLKRSPMMGPRSHPDYPPIQDLVFLLATELYK